MESLLVKDRAISDPSSVQIVNQLGNALLEACMYIVAVIHVE